MNESQKISERSIIAVFTLINTTVAVLAGFMSNVEQLITSLSIGAFIVIVIIASTVLWQMKKISTGVAFLLSYSAIITGILISFMILFVNFVPVTVTGKVIGELEDRTEQQISGCIRIIDKDGTTLAQVEPNQSGIYNFFNVPSGSYRLDVLGRVREFEVPGGLSKLWVTGFTFQIEKEREIFLIASTNDIGNTNDLFSGVGAGSTIIQSPVPSLYSSNCEGIQSIS